MKEKIKRAFSFLKVTKQIENEDDYSIMKNWRYWVRLLMLFFVICGGSILVGGIFCITTFEVAKVASILLIVFGAISLILGGLFYIYLKNIVARINLYKQSGDEQ